MSSPRPIIEIVLSTGESLSSNLILEAFLRLAASRAGFPMMGEQDVHLACLMLVPEVIAFNQWEDIL